jgi:hypothetical protein
LSKPSSSEIFIVTVASRRLGKRRRGSWESGGCGGANAALASNAGDGRSIAGRVGLKGIVHRVWLKLNDLGLDEDRDDLASGQTELAVVKGLEKAGDDAGVGGDAEPGVVVGAEDVVEDGVGPDILGVTSLGEIRAPELVELGETLLELVPGESSEPSTARLQRSHPRSLIIPCCLVRE